MPHLAHTTARVSTPDITWKHDGFPGLRNVDARATIDAPRQHRAETFGGFVSTQASGPRGPGRMTRIAAVMCGFLSIGVLIAITAARPRTWTPSAPAAIPTATERGDPVLAGQLDQQATAAS